MAKSKKVFLCSNCETNFSKWSGQCSECAEWDTITEQEQPVFPNKYSGYSGALSEAQTLSEVNLTSESRIKTGMAELDRVLGGGLVQGSVVLIGGDPGVGKSTALLQVSGTLSSKIPVLYVTGEESPQQIAMRAKRLRIPDSNLRILAETRIEHICAVAASEKPHILIIDSIQTMQVADVSSAPGSVSQVRESAARLTRFAKESGTAIFLVGHVTKTGDIAGPRVLEHIIDVVCYIEGERDSQFRIIRAVKNRYGAVNELGVFAMTENGLQEISNPSAIFLTRGSEPMPGSVVMAIWEGSRPLLIEIQALVDESHAENPRRVTLGLEQNRLAMLLAVLHKHGGVVTYNQDVFVNVVGGVKVNETSADLATILAIVSSLRNMPLPRDMIVFGETGLSGEIRPVSGGQERLREAAKHGFKTAIIPAANAPKEKMKGLQVIPVEKISEAIAAL
ncbi:MAG: DNA repair protein RadA [Desulforhopalus sp.]|nr:DNA repair protein RadA [Desulforhopalus sp.]